MSNQIPYRDSLYRLAQTGSAVGVQLVRIVSMADGNRYMAEPVEFDSDGCVQPAQARSIVVTNLGEPADTPGQLPSETQAVALDVEGRWVIFVRQSGSANFPARIIGPAGSRAAYEVKEQVATDQGQFTDKSSGRQVTASNLAELTLGDGAALPAGTIVLVGSITTENGSARFAFDHPAYAKYLD